MSDIKCQNCGGKGFEPDDPSARIPCMSCTPEPIKPSEQIKQMVKKVAKQRADRASAATGIPILGRNTGIVQRLEQDPMTWVMAILAYLDGQDQ